MHKYLAFDLEIAKIMSDDAGDLKTYRPLGITCAAALLDDADPVIWHGETASGAAADQMARSEAQDVVRYLQGAVERGRTLLTWNGVGFDFDILAEESGMLTECRQLAVDHVDMMFHLFCLQGYPLGLDKAAKGMGLAGKPAGMSGALAPPMWAAGQRQEVLQYLEEDVRTTLALAKAVEEQGALRWVSQRGKPMELRLPHGWLTVRQAMALSSPDTSWMPNPWPRSKFTGWLHD
jgi:hypothetical protein